MEKDKDKDTRSKINQTRSRYTTTNNEFSSVFSV